MNKALVGGDSYQCFFWRGLSDRSDKSDKSGSDKSDIVKDLREEVRFVVAPCRRGVSPA